MSAKPKVILHVGMDKTGTSAIQFALHDAQDRLRQDHGLLVPRTGLWHDFSHHPFAFAALGISGYAPGDQARLFADLRTEVANSACHTVLLTSECLFKVPFRKSHDIFMSHLREMFDDIRVVIYVRRQDIWIESRHRHSVVSGRELKVQSLMTKGYSGYLQFIDCWAELVGDQNVTVRPYESSQFPNGDIAADFQQVIGLPEGALPSQRDSRHNVTFRTDAVLLRSALNHLQLPSAHYSALNKYLLTIPVADKAPDQKFVSPAKAIAVVREFTGMNNEIARRFLGRDVLFSDPLPVADKGWAPPDLSAERMVELLGYLAACDARLVGVIAARARTTLVASLPSAAAAKAVWALLAGLSTLEGGAKGRVGARRPLGASSADDASALAVTPARPDLGRSTNRAVIWANEAALTVSLGLQRLRSRRSAVPSAPVSGPPAVDRAPPSVSVPADLPDTHGAGKPARKSASPRKAIPEARELLVHFGVFKTGTTSIQRTLHAHSDRLKGAAYVHGKIANSSLMLRHVCQSKQKLVKILGPYADGDRLDHNAKTSKERLLKSMSEAKSRSDRLILSAEIIASFVAPELKTMADLLSPHARKMHFVGYMRDPISLSRSIFQERIKNKVAADFRFDHAVTGGIRMHGIVNRLDAVFGRENVTVFPYDRGLFPGGDVVKHFLQAAQVEDDGLEVERVNESLSHLAVKALYAYRRMKSQYEDPKEAKSREAFVASLKALNGPAFAFHSDLEARIAEQAGAAYSWAEHRLGARLPEKSDARDYGIRVEQDLFTFSAPEIEMLADHARSLGVRALPAGQDAEAVAETMHLIRLHFRSKSESGLARILSRPWRREHSGAT